MERTVEEHFENLRSIIDGMNPGDVIVMASMFDISESIKETLDIYTYAWKKKVDLRFLETPWTNSDFLRQNNVTILAARNIIASTYETKKTFNNYRHEAEQRVHKTRKGYPSPLKGRTLHSKKKDRLKPQILQRSRTFGIGHETDRALIKAFGISKNTYYKYKKELLEESHQKQSSEADHK